MPTPAWRAISSSGASRPWSQTTCRAAGDDGAAVALGVAPQRWTGRRSPQGQGNAGIWRATSALFQVIGRPEGYLRFVEGVVAMTTEVKTTGRPDSGQAIARRAGGDRPSRDRDDTPPQAVA